MQRRPSPLLLTAAAVALVATACSYTSREVLPVAPEEIQSSTLYSDDGTLVYTFHAEENRKVIPLEEIPRHVRDAVIAIEDERFYRHNGVDVRGLLRAVKADAEAGGAAQGGSTITQQYVKQEILGDSSQTMKRKLEDASMAVQLERKYSKDRILELYLNAIYFGNGAYGIEAAAHQYFGKTTQQLTLAEGALLAGLIQRPSATDPYNHLEEATARRNVVLDRVQANAFASEADVKAAQASPVQLASATLPAAQRYPAAYFVEDVKQWILDDPQFGDTPKARRDLLFGGGLHIETTVDLRLQAEAERAANEILPDPNGPAASLVSVEPTTGYVKAMVGGRNFFGPGRYDKLNLASQGRGRSSGSSFKPFVLATAIEQGMDPFKVRFPAPACITLPLPHEVWHPCNAEVANEGHPTIAEGTVHSINTLYAQLMLKVGPQAAIDTATRLGVMSPLQPNPAAVLGTNDVNALDMASAYATFANLGVHVPPTLVTKITRADGTILYEHHHTQTKAINRDTAATVSNILTGVIERGTGTKGKLDRPAAGKTGTAQDFSDAWFVGYTPELSTAVWVGFPEAGPDGKARPLTPPNTPIRVFGGTYPTQIWQRFMAAALAGRPPVAFPDLPTTTTTLAPGSVVHVDPAPTTGLGPATLVPKVVGLSLADAAKALEAQGFVVETAAGAGGQKGKAKNRVSAQSPPAGTSAPKGSTVTIEVDG